MLYDKLTMIINTCDKFSDLWDVHMLLLNQNWADRDIQVILATDSTTGRTFDSVEIVSAGDGIQMPGRIAAALESVRTEYILITLDDYFPIYPIDSVKLQRIIEQMEQFSLDYVRLFKRPNSMKKIKGSDLYEIGLHKKKDHNYQVNLYAGIWRRSFLEKTLEQRCGCDAWAYEVSLSETARRIHARCAMSKGKEFETLDVVRKGKLLHKSAAYLKKYDLYHGSRTVISWKEEFRINFFTAVKACMPEAFVEVGRKILRKRGWKFYSDAAKQYDE